jgi:hypothetical protein
MGHRTAVRRANLLSRAQNLMAEQLVAERRANDALRQLLDVAPPPPPRRASASASAWSRQIMIAWARRVGVALGRAGALIRLRAARFGPPAPLCGTLVATSLAAAIGAALALFVMGSPRPEHASLSATPLAPVRAPVPVSASVRAPVPVPMSVSAVPRPLPWPEPERRLTLEDSLRPVPRGLGALIRELRFARCGARGWVSARLWLDDDGAVDEVVFERGVRPGSRVDRCLRRVIDRMIPLGLGGPRSRTTWVSFGTPYGDG